MNKKDINPVALALGVTGMLACSSALAGENPFSIHSSSTQGVQVAGSHEGEGMCGDHEAMCGTHGGMCGTHMHGEGKCGASEEGKCGMHSEGKCGMHGEGMCGEKMHMRMHEGECGMNMKMMKMMRKMMMREGKCGEGKCGEGKCGGKQ